MHEIGCARNNYKCRECGEIVAKYDREEHEETAHKLSKCQYCNFEATKQAFGTHEEKCDMRPRPCQWCDEIFPMQTWADHIEMCGTKTLFCEDCSSFIQKKYWANHKGSR